MTHTRNIRLFAFSVLTLLLVSLMPFGVFAEEAVPEETAVAAEEVVATEEAAEEEVDPLVAAEEFIDGYSDNVENTDEFTQ